MGGDFAPEQTVLGAYAAVESLMILKLLYMELNQR